MGRGQKVGLTLGSIGAFFAATPEAHGLILIVVGTCLYFI